jgi:co-chaperonin GroES (HSP10)
MQAIQDYYTIKVESQRVETIEYGSLKLTLATEVDGHYIQGSLLQNDAGLTYKGIVLGVPERLSNKGLGRYESGGSTFDRKKYDKKVSDLPKPIIEVGDTVYMEYNAVSYCETIAENTYMVSYPLIIAAIRNGELVSQGDNIILETIKEERKSLLLDIEQKDIIDQGRVIACRKEHPVKVGDMVLLKYDSAPYEIEGVTRYVARLSDVLAVLPEITESLC